MTSTGGLREMFEDQVNKGYNNMAWADTQSKSTPQPPFQVPNVSQIPASNLSQMNENLGQSSNYQRAQPIGLVQQPPTQPNDPSNNPPIDKTPFYKNKKVMLFIGVVVAILAVGGFFLYKYVICKKPKSGDDEDDETSEMKKFQRMTGMMQAPPHFPNPAQMPNTQTMMQPPAPIALSQQPQLQQPQPQPQPQFQQPQPQFQQPQGRREQQHGPPPASSGFPQGGRAPQQPSASEDNDPMFTKLSDLP